MLFALMLSRVDDGVVRFMTLSGNRFRRIFAYHAGGAAAFIGAALLVSWAVIGATGTAIVAAAFCAMLLLALRISAYRLLKKGGADLLIAGLLGLLAILAYSLPPALPIAGCVGWRRPVSRSWSAP